MEVYVERSLNALLDYLLVVPCYKTPDAYGKLFWLLSRHQMVRDEDRLLLTDSISAEFPGEAWTGWITDWYSNRRSLYLTSALNFNKWNENVRPFPLSVFQWVGEWHEEQEEEWVKQKKKYDTCRYVVLLLPLLIEVMDKAVRNKLSTPWTLIETLRDYFVHHNYTLFSAALEAYYQDMLERDVFASFLFYLEQLQLSPPRATQESLTAETWCQSVMYLFSASTLSGPKCSTLLRKVYRKWIKNNESVYRELVNSLLQTKEFKDVVQANQFSALVAGNISKRC